MTDGDFRGEVVFVYTNFFQIFRSV